MIGTAGLPFRPEIDDENVSQNGTDQFAEFLVVGMPEIGIAIGGALEAQDKTVRESFVVLLWTHIGSPFVGDDLRNLLLQCPEGVLDFLDLCWRSRWLELEGNHVNQFGFGLCAWRVGRE